MGGGGARGPRALTPPPPFPPPPGSATPEIMYDVFTNYTRALRDWLEIDDALAALGVDTMDEARERLGFPPPSAADLALGTESTTIYDVKTQQS